MELTKQLELLKQLCEIDGVSGGEEKVADWLKNHLPEDCKVRTDALGNLICEKKGKQTPKNKLLFSVHMDEVGFIITYIEESGLLRFSSMGSIDTRVVVGKPVRLESGALGVVGAKPIHLQSASDRETVLSFQDKGAFMDRELFALAKKLCEEKEIPYQIKNQIVGATDAAAMSKAGNGCRVLTVAAPVRYVHSPSSMFDPRDLESCARLLRELVGALAQL